MGSKLDRDLIRGSWWSWSIISLLALSGRDSALLGQSSCYFEQKAYRNVQPAVSIPDNTHRDARLNHPIRFDHISLRSSWVRMFSLPIFGADLYRVLIPSTVEPPQSLSVGTQLGSTKKLTRWHELSFMLFIEIAIHDRSSIDHTLHFFH